MSSAVKLTNPVGGSLSLVMDDTVTTDETYQVPSTDWDGVVLGGAELTAVGIVGTNPYATLYPDGSIVGGSDNGTFTKWANGELECIFNTTQFFNSITEYPSWTYPMIFPNLPLYGNLVVTSNSGTYIYGSSFYNIQTTSAGGIFREVSGNANPGTTYPISWIATGRWK